MRWRLAALLLAALPALAAAARRPDLYVMRHLDSRGAGAAARLSETGANQARALAGAFAAAPPAAIYVATAQVSLDSAAWLAIERDVTPILFDPADLPALLARLSDERGPVLIVADRATVDAILERAGGRPARMAEAEAIEIWHVPERRAE